MKMQEFEQELQDEAGYYIANMYSHYFQAALLKCTYMSYLAAKAKYLLTRWSLECLPICGHSTSELKSYIYR